MIIALTLFGVLFASYLGLGHDWIRDMVNLILGTIIGALKVSLTHSDTNNELLPVKNDKLLETAKAEEYVIDIEALEDSEETKEQNKKKIEEIKK